MQFEKIRTINKRKVIIGGLIGLGVISVGVLATSRAKYRTAESFNIVNGTINYRVADLNVVAMYSSEDGSNYTELTERMPDNGYIINEEKSYCNLNGNKDTNAILKTINGNHVISNLIKGDKCYLYFDKERNVAEDVLANLGIENPKEPTTDMFASVATTDEGVFSVTDPVYGGTSYYYRGAVINNYVKFAGFCWRIIRINGDGSIRLIYDGATCHANGTSTAESLAVASQVYNTVSNASYHIGYTYEESLQRPSDNAALTASNLKTQTDSWYKINIIEKGYDEKVEEGKFCNDRNMATGYSWSTMPNSTFYYAGYDRAGAKSTDDIEPTLSCNENDIYILKSGSITIDEAIMAGGKWETENSKYYLYNGYHYWTMSPSGWSGSDAISFRIISGGNLDWGNVKWTGMGIRPVINLKVNTLFKQGTDGTQNNPFEVI